MVVRTPWGGGVHGGQHHSQSIETYYAHMPGIKVVAPAFPADYRSLLKASIADPNPVFSWSTSAPTADPAGSGGGARGDRDWPCANHAPGRRPDDHRLRPDASRIACCRRNAAAKDRVHRRGLAHAITARPRNDPRIGQGDRQGADRARRQPDRWAWGEIAAIVAEHAFEYLDAPVRRVAGPDVPSMPYHHAMEDFYMPNREKIAAAARELAAYWGSHDDRHDAPAR